MKAIEFLITALPYALAINLILMIGLEIVNYVYKKYWLEN